MGLNALPHVRAKNNKILGGFPGIHSFISLPVCQCIYSQAVPIYGWSGLPINPDIYYIHPVSNMRSDSIPITRPDSTYSLSIVID